ncbi:hypothetical protein HDV05_003486 [Chytridiales sp. JEL 0842]|nr:hypothetical protein HDV05_003486 [Chytridiales sp. JEL 0842]
MMMIKSEQVAGVVGGVPTDVVVTEFADRVFVIITQLGKIGHLMQATSTDVVAPGGVLSSGNPSTVKSLLGTSDSEFDVVFTDHIKSKLSAKRDDRSLLLSLALKRRDESGKGGLEKIQQELFGELVKLLETTSVFSKL